MIPKRVIKGSMLTVFQAKKRGVVQAFRPAYSKAKALHYDTKYKHFMF